MGVPSTRHYPVLKASHYGTYTPTAGCPASRYRPFAWLLIQRLWWKREFIIGRFELKLFIQQFVFELILFEQLLFFQ